MRILRIALFALLVASAGAAVLVGGLLLAAPVPKKLPDEELILGRWKLVEVRLSADGEKPRDEDTDWKTAVYEFRKDGTYTHTQKGMKPGEGTYKLDPTAQPKAFDTTSSDKYVTQGLYELDGDTLRLCIGRAADAKRPTDLKADAKTSTHLWVFERVKEK